MRCCRHDDGRCLDGDAPCSECDTEGYPLDARRRLKRTADGMVEDIDDGRRFRLKRTKTGLERLVPVFDGRVDWSSDDGFYAMLLLVSCLGTKGEYVLWDSERKEEMDRTEWRRRGYGCFSIAPILHTRCGEMNLTTTSASLKATGCSIGCRCHSTKSNHWRYRRADVVHWGESRGFKVLTTETEWVKKCTGKDYCPSLQCRLHDVVVSTTCINSLRSGNGVGCPRCCIFLNEWRDRYDEFRQLLPEGYELMVSETDWKNQCIHSHTYCPPIRCRQHDVTVRTTCIARIQQQKGVGCPRCCIFLNEWRDRYDEFRQLLPEGYALMVSETDWKNQCTGNTYCPPIRCLQHDVTVRTTRIAAIQQQQGGVGCPQCCVTRNLWKYRYDEVVALGKEGGFEVATTAEQWLQECSGANYRPKLRCLVCDETVTSTRTHSLHQGQGIGCACGNKTECRLFKWMQEGFPSAVVSRQYSGPTTLHNGQTHFDFHLTFPDGLEVLVELDGEQHFWPSRYFTNAGCERDLQKETWALAQGLGVIRVLQEDVWNDRLDWQGWISRSIEAARECGDARVFTPDAPEYRSNESAYVKFHGIC